MEKKQSQCRDEFRIQEGAKNHILTYSGWPPNSQGYSIKVLSKYTSRLVDNGTHKRHWHWHHHETSNFQQGFIWLFQSDEPKNGFFMKNHNDLEWGYMHHIPMIAMKIHEVSFTSRTSKKCVDVSGSIAMLLILGIQIVVQKCVWKSQHRDMKTDHRFGDHVAYFNHFFWETDDVEPYRRSIT